MIAGQNEGRLSREARASLIERMRHAGPPVEASAPSPEYDTSFDTLPGFEEMRLMRAAAELFGVPNPFFRCHDVRAGATSEIGGAKVLNFASYDYLGLNGHPAVLAAAHEGVDRFGCSVSASRVVAGERGFHRELETALAEIYAAEDAVVFVSGHAANVTTIGSLVGPNDIVFHDALVHNSAIVGADLARARRRPFPHNDLDALEAMLASERPAHGRALIVVEGHYSMDGDVPDLARLVALKRRFGAWLMVDEAHSLGVLGARGRGIAELAGVDPGDVDIWMGTLSKTLASCGGYIAGARLLIDYLKLSAPGFVYSVGLSAPASLAALTALRLMTQDGARVAKLQANSRHFLSRAQAAGLDTGTAEGHSIVPIIVGDSLKAVVLANRLLERGINVMPIIHPAVPHKSARLRFFITAEHEVAQLDTALRVLQEELVEAGRFMTALGLGGEEGPDEDPDEPASRIGVPGSSMEVAR